MKQYSVSDDSSYQQQMVSSDHFGINLVTTYDEEFVDPENELVGNVRDLGAQTLRFPGGSATENYFDMTQPDLDVSSRVPSETLTPMDQFFERAGTIGVAVTIVIPTQMAFTTGAAQAMLDGTYGTRSDIDGQYLLDVQTFVDIAVSYALANSVEIKAFEIGNEFWGSGQMSAAEYGVVAGTLVSQIDTQLEATTEISPEIVVQTTSAASRLYSSRDSVEAYVGTKDGTLQAFSQNDINNQFGGVVPEDFQTVTVAGQGSARSQVAQIADGINAVPDAADAVDGVVQHYYESGGFIKADNSKSFKFSQFQRMEGLLDRREGSEDLSYHVTEWNTNASGAANNRGLQNASMIIETFFELVSNDVDVAQIWPLSFDAAQGISLVDLDGDGLSISGEMFRMMSESLVGLMPTLDWSVPYEIDIHGFSNEARDVFFVSERSGSNQGDIELNMAGFLDSGPYFVTSTQLWDGGAGGADAHAAPEITYLDGVMSSGQILSFDLDSWANLRIEVVNVGAGDDIVTGRGGADRIETFGGQDVISGGDGNDTIDAGDGADVIDGGNGNDFIMDGAGSDTIDGGAGEDIVSLKGMAADHLIVIDTASVESGSLQITSGDGNLDVLRNLEILQFDDRNVSVADITAYTEKTFGSAARSNETSIEVSVAEIISSSTPVCEPKLEVGRTSIEQINSAYWQTVAFTETIKDAAVIMGPASQQGGQPFTVRVRNVTEEGFEFQIDEWDYLDGYHLEVEIAWFAGTIGMHQLEDGSTIGLGSVQVESVNRITVETGSFEDQPIIFGQLSGDAEDQSLTHRIDNVAQTEFDLQVQVEEASRTSTQAIEKTSFFWAAIDVAEDSFLFEDVSMSVNHRYQDTGLTLDDGESLFADMQTLSGRDPGVLRYHTNDTGDLSLRIQEERSKDRETHHVDEETALITINEGLYSFV